MVDAARELEHAERGLPSVQQSPSWYVAIGTTTRLAPTRHVEVTIR